MHDAIATQQNFNSINHLLNTVTTWWLNSDCIVNVVNCWQPGDYNASGSSVTMLLAIVNSDYSVTVSHCVVTVVNCWQHGDYTANGSSVTMLLAIVNSDYSVTVSHCVVTVVNCWQHGDYTANGSAIGSNQQWLQCHCPVTVVTVFSRWLME